jgi:purine-binding chemotaxis protein CheW
MQLVIFRVADEKYALPIDRVQEIIRYSPPRPLEGGVDGALRGVISLRGSIIPVFDLADRLGLQAAPGGEAEIVIVEGPDQTIGVIVDDVDEVHAVSEEELVPVPVQGSDAFTAIAKLDDALVAIVDADAVFGGATGGAVALDLAA